MEKTDTSQFEMLQTQNNKPTDDIYQKHAALQEMFPDLDIEQVLANYGHMTPDALGAFLVDHIDEMPKKINKTEPKIRKRKQKSIDDPLSDIHSDEEYTGLWLLDKMLQEMVITVKKELCEEVYRIDSTEINNVKKFLEEKFHYVRAQFVLDAFRVFEGHFVATCFACFFAQNSQIHYVKKITSRLTPGMYMRNQHPLVRSRFRLRAVEPYNYPSKIVDAYERYCTLLEEYKGKYPELLESETCLREQAATVPYEVNEEDMSECLVCFEQVTTSRMISCKVSELTGMEDWKFVVNQPGSSSALTQASNPEPISLMETDKEAEPSNSNCNNQNEVPINESTPKIEEKAKNEQVLAENNDFIKEHGVSVPQQFHSFCRNCVRGQAQAATTDIPLAPGGLGLKCMVIDCPHILRYAEIRNIIPKMVREKLEARIIDENIGIAHIINLERCPKCNYAVELDVPTEVNKVFNCLNCKAQSCRLCDAEWEEHFGMSCEELEEKIDQRDKRNREIERRMNEAVVRTCPRCRLIFVKEMGCNKMTCRCGMKMCYICRKTDIEYDHFCQHPRDPSKKDQKCTQCDKTCLLWQDYRKHDAMEIEKIRNENDQPSSSNIVN